MSAFRDVGAVYWCPVQGCGFAVSTAKGRHETDSRAGTYAAAKRLQGYIRDHNAHAHPWTTDALEAVIGKLESER